MMGRLECIRRKRLKGDLSIHCSLLILLGSCLGTAASDPEVQFTDITEQTRIDFTQESSATSNKYLIETMGGGVALLDYDNDGRLDIFFTNGARLEDPMPEGKLPDKSDRKYWNRLYHQNADGTFTDVTVRAGVSGASQGFYGMGVAVGDYDNDGLEDIYVTGYGGNTLYHNNGNGTFTDVSEKAGITNPHGKGLGVAFADYDGDGFTDIFVANDSVQCFLYHNNGNGTFSETGLLAGVGYNEDGKTFAGMGVDFSDYDNDGFPDIVVTDLSNERYMLFRNNGDGTFRDVTNQSGLGGATLAFSGWSTRFFDYDNDGWKDIFVAQSHVMDTIEKTSGNLKYLEPPLLLRNESGHFSRVVAGDAFQKSWAGRGAAFGDIDNDGDLDIVVSNVGQKPYVLRNDGGNRRSWLGIELVGMKSNRDGIGARIRVVSSSGLTQYFTVNTAVGYLSASDKRLIVGLGADPVAKTIEVRWPSGIVQKFENVKARQYLKAVEPRQ